MQTKTLNPNFTECVHALITLANVTDDMHHECDAWYAPSECHNDIQRHYERDVAETLADYGFDADSLWAEVHKRGLGEKWQYENLPPIEFVH